MSNNVFFDTSGFISLMDDGGRVSPVSLSLLHDLSSSGCKFFTTDYVLDELLTWMRCKKKFNIKKVVNFIANTRVSDVQVIGITQDLFDDALQLMKKYKDHFFSFTDCVSFCVMKEIGIRDVFGLDKHFSIVGFNNLLKI